LVDPPVSEFYVPTFRNTLFHIRGSREHERLIKMEQSVLKRRNIKFRRRWINQNKEQNIHNTAKVWNREK